MAKRKRSGAARVTALAMRILGFGVLGLALFWSGYSLWFVMCHFGVPSRIAVTFSAVVDGAALYMAFGSLQDAQEGRTGTGARLWVFGLVGLSAFLNSFHASLGHETRWSMAGWAALPIIAAGMYDYIIRKERRDALEAAGLLYPSLPRIPFTHLVFFGVRAYHSLKEIAQKYWDATVAEAMARADERLASARNGPKTIQGHAEPANVTPAVTAPETRPATRVSARISEPVPRPANVTAAETASDVTGPAAEPAEMPDVTDSVFTSVKLAENDANPLPPNGRAERGNVTRLEPSLAERVCEAPDCNETFRPATSAGRFCSSRCRVAAHRARRAAGGA
jgi:hypothetical protein